MMQIIKQIVGRGSQLTGKEMPLVVKLLTHGLAT